MRAFIWTVPQTVTGRHPPQRATHTTKQIWVRLMRLHVQPATTVCTEAAISALLRYSIPTATAMITPARDRVNPLMLSRIRRPAQQTLRLMEQLLVHTTILLSVVRSMFRLLFRQRITRTSRKLIPFTKTAQNSPAATLRAILSTLMRL